MKIMFDYKTIMAIFDKLFSTCIRCSNYNEADLITCFANDYGYDDVFSRQVAGLASAGDVLIAISTSGSSSSVLAACEQARALGCEVVGLTGRDGGALKGSCDTAVVAPADDTAHIQECHIVVVHLLCALIEQGLELA